MSGGGLAVLGSALAVVVLVGGVLFGYVRDRRRIAAEERKAQRERERAEAERCRCVPVPSHHRLVVHQGEQRHEYEVARSDAHAAEARIWDTRYGWLFRAEFPFARWQVRVPLLNGSTATVWAPSVTLVELHPVADEGGIPLLPADES